MTRWVLLFAGAAAALVPAFALAAETASFTARGNEPFWRAEITESAITFEPMGGGPVTISPKPEAKGTADGQTYAATVDGKPFALSIADKLCVDTMSGMHFPKTVSVVVGDKTYSGCGGDPASLLQGEWVIETIGGKAIVPESKPSMTFGPEGKLSGNASCNRYFGPYELTGEGIKISNLATSMMMCDEKTMEQERLLLKSLQSTTRFEVDQAGKLILIGADGAAVVGRRK
jgi:heat shock protein HslJ